MLIFKYYFASLVTGEGCEFIKLRVNQFQVVVIF
jgi:hypothetical protein